MGFLLARFLVSVLVLSATRVRAKPSPTLSNQSALRLSGAFGLADASAQIHTLPTRGACEERWIGAERLNLASHVVVWVRLGSEGVGFSSDASVHRAQAHPDFLLYSDRPGNRPRLVSLACLQSEHAHYLLAHYPPAYYGSCLEQ